MSAEGKYVPREQSVHFPFLPLDEFVRFLDLRTQMDESSLIRSFREWIGTSLLPQTGNAPSK